MLYKALIHCNICRMQVHLSNKVLYVNLRILRHLKEELTWPIDKHLEVISNKMLFKTTVPLRILDLN